MGGNCQQDSLPTIFILQLARSLEDAVGDADLARLVVGAVHLTVLAQLGQDLGGLQGVSPGVVPVTVKGKNEM